MQMEIEMIIEYGLLIVIDIDSTLNCIRQCDTKRMWTDRRQLCAVGWMVFFVIVIGIGIGICFVFDRESIVQRYYRRVVSYVCVCVCGQ